MAAFSFQIQDIDETGKDYAFQLTAVWLDETLADAGLRADPARAPGALVVHVQQNDTEYLVAGQLDAELFTECCRCLGEARVPVHVPFSVLFARHAQRAVGRPPTEVIELAEEDLEREQFTGNEIVLDEFVREQLVIECPMQPLCSPDCAGIPVPEKLRPPVEVFGSSATGVDPRLAPLMRLRDKVPPNKVPPKKE